MAKGSVVIDINAVDQASPVVKKASEEAQKAAARIVGTEKQISEATKSAARAKQEQLTLGQKYKFALEKEAAAGDKVKLSLVNQREELAKLERKLRAAIKAGDKEAETLAKQTVKMRENIRATEEAEARKEKYKITLGGTAKAIAAVGVAIGAATAAAFLFTKKINEQGDDFQKHSARLGMTAEEYQKLNFAMQISGTSIDQQAGAMRKFQQVARDADAGVKKSAEAFQLLGVSIKGNDGNLKTAKELFLDLADGYSKTEAGIKRTSAVQDIFGRSGLQLHQTLMAGSTGIAAMGSELEALGGVMSTSAAKGAEEFNDNLLRMNAGFKGIGITVANEMTPVFSEAMAAIADSFKRLKPAYEPIFDEMVRFIKDSAHLIVPIATMLAKMFVGLGTTVKVAWDTIILSINTALSAIPALVNKAIDIINLVLPAGKKLEKFGNNFRESAEETAKGIDATIEASARTLAEIDRVGARILAANTERRKTPDLINAETSALAGQLPALEKNAGLKDKEAARVDSFVQGRARMREANLQLTEDMIKQAEKVAEANKSASEATRTEYINTGASIATSFGVAFGEGISGAESWQEAMGVAAMNAANQIFQYASNAIMAKAAVAAAGAAESQSFIPYVGPILAVIALGAMLGTVQGLLSNLSKPKKAKGMAKGGIVGGVGNEDNQPALLTPGEIVLPKKLSQMLLDVVDRRSAGGAMQQGGLVTSGGAPIVVNFNENSITPRTPAELDRFVRDDLVPVLRRLKNKGVAI